MQKLIIAVAMFVALVALAQTAGTKSPAASARTKSVVSTPDAPKALGPYSQAIKVGDFVFCAGQTPRDPATGKLIEGDISAQTDRVLKNIGAVLTAAGTDFDHAVKVNVYLKNMSDFEAMNKVYAQYFKAMPPARATIGVNELPAGALVEIEVAAILPEK
jgi:2-iminobutanoate/2-iminopropanoate deaminase